MGYTVADVRGGCVHESRDASCSEDRNIRLELIAQQSIAHELAAYVLATSAKDFRLSIFLADVSVLRPDRY